MKSKGKSKLGNLSADLGFKILRRFITNRGSEVNQNVQTTFNLDIDFPNIHLSSYIHPKASVIGSVEIGGKVFVAPFASIRGDEGLNIFIGDESNVQDGTVIHGLKNFEFGTNLTQNSIFVDDKPYSVYIGKRVTLAHQCQIHGPARVDSNVFVGMQSLVFNSYVQEGVVIEPGAKVIGVTVPRYRYVSAGLVITSQVQADHLPEITPEYPYYEFNQKVVKTNTELAWGYRRST